ncbi:MAG: hypothetical protein LBH18_06110 [Spirochaetaceae bacterium]|jgi:hypothetical protein|nr:hypothetical protein [Spirochaetaceae bacterium]
MANYLDIQNIGNINFIVTDAKLAAGGLFKAHYLWAETQKGEVDEISTNPTMKHTIKLSKNLETI